MSRKLFGTDGIRGEANVYPLVSSVALKLGRALASTVKDEPGSSIVIGKDTRLEWLYVRDCIGVRHCIYGG